MVYFEQDGDSPACVTDKRKKEMVNDEHESAAEEERSFDTLTAVSRIRTPIKVLHIWSTTLKHINEAEVTRTNAKSEKLDLIFLSKALVL